MVKCEMREWLSEYFEGVDADGHCRQYWDGEKYVNACDTCPYQLCREGEARLAACRTERDRYRDAVNACYEFQEGLKAQRDTLREALGQISWERDYGYEDKDLIHWMRATARKALKELNDQLILSGELETPKGGRE